MEPWVLSSAYLKHADQAGGLARALFWYRGLLAGHHSPQAARAAPRARKPRAGGFLCAAGKLFSKRCP
eukprot:6910992-Lingulodinium_polyedra.AAC.1